MNRMKRIGLMLLIIFACTGCDQTTKYLASNWLAHDSISSYAHDMFRFEYTENPGAFLGLGSTLSQETRYHIFVMAVTLGLLVMFLYTALHKKMKIDEVIAFSIVIGGGISNLYDRVVNNGLVVDFMNIGIGELRTGIFNLADVFIMVGFAMLIFHVARARKKSLE